MIKFIALLIAATIALTPAAQAAKNPRAGTSDARIKTFSYHPKEVYSVKAHLGFATSIEFAHDETIQTITLGDTYSWQATTTSHGNLMFLKPIEPNANTNMTVITNARTYTFELTAQAAKSHKSKDLSFRIEFIYPHQIDEQLAYASKRRNNGFSKDFNPSSIAPEHWNFAYNYAGNKAIRPTRAFDDGHFTYLKFAKNTSVPAIFSVDENGDEAIVNYSTQGAYIVIETIAPQFVLRDGKRATCIINKAYAGTQAKPNNNRHAINRSEEATFPQPRKTNN